MSFAAFFMLKSFEKKKTPLLCHIFQPTYRLFKFKTNVRQKVIKIVIEKIYKTECVLKSSYKYPYTTKNQHPKSQTVACGPMSHKLIDTQAHKHTHTHTHERE